MTDVTRPKLVIFDCDGVLVDSESAHSEVVAASLTRYGLPMTPEDCMSRFVGNRMATIGEAATVMGAALPDDWVREVYAEIFVKLREGVPIIPGIPALLDELDAAGIPYCVGSNGSEDKTEITLGHIGIHDRFAGRIFSAYTLNTWKPEPGLYLHAAQALGVAAADSVVVEDSVTGATAAQRAGMRCFGYAPHDDGAGLAAVGATVFHDMAALPDLLGLAEADMRDEAPAQSLRSA